MAWVQPQSMTVPCALRQDRHPSQAAQSFYLTLTHGAILPMPMSYCMSTCSDNLSDSDLALDLLTTSEIDSVWGTGRRRASRDRLYCITSMRMVCADHRLEFAKDMHNYQKRTMDGVYCPTVELGCADAKTQNRENHAWQTTEDSQPIYPCVSWRTTNFFSLPTMEMAF